MFSSKLICNLLILFMFIGQFHLNSSLAVIDSDRAEIDYYEYVDTVQKQKKLQQQEQQQLQPKQGKPEDYYDENNYDASQLDDTQFKKIQLNSLLEFKCPNVLTKQLSISNQKTFSFKEMIFNRSIDDIKFLPSVTFNQQNKDVFYTINSNENFINTFADATFRLANNTYSRSHAKYADSGRFFCVYQNTDDSNQYLITNIVYLVYDEQIIAKNFNETVELEPCVDYNPREIQAYKNDIKWLYDSNYISDSSSNIVLNSETYKIKLKLNDMRMFDYVYRCQNERNGAFKSFKIECLNCDAFLYAPLIAPIRQEVPVGSQSQLTCQKAPNANEPDRYQWFKQPIDKSEINQNLTISQSIGYGSILELKNITEKDAGWYICCIVNSILKPNERVQKLLDSDYDVSDSLTNSWCSSAELKVLKPNETELDQLKRSNKISMSILIAILSCSVSFLFMTLVTIYLCNKKLKTFKNTHKATKQLEENELYRSQKIPLTKVDYEKLDETNVINLLESSSSIEKLLKENEINKWRLPNKALKLGQLVGKGAFGVVYNGELDVSKISLNKSGLETNSYLIRQVAYLKSQNLNKLNVAVKKLPENAEAKNYYELLKELKLMFHVGQHQHIVNLIGYYVEETSLCIVTDFAKHGNLKDFLRQSTSEKIGSDHLMLYSYQIAKGMEFLHSKKVLHRDLAARNILVYDVDSIKIADFGLARNICSDYYYVQKLCDKMPYKWMSPESLTVNKISEESDAWSYGVLLWEIYTYGCTPYPSIPIEQILEKLTAGYRMDKPESCDVNIYHNTMLACWHWEPKKRPKFNEIVEKFEKFLEQSEYEQTKILLENRRKRYSCASYQTTMDFENNNEECLSDTTKTTNTSSMTSETSALSGAHQLNTTFNSSSGSSQNQNTSQISSLASSITSEKNDKDVFGKLQKIDESINLTTELEQMNNKFTHKFGNNKLNFFKKLQSSLETTKDEKDTKFQQLQKPNNIETNWPVIYK